MTHLSLQIPFLITELGKDNWKFQTAIYLVITNPRKNTAPTTFAAAENTTSGFMKNVTPWYIFSKVNVRKIHSFYLN